MKIHGLFFCAAAMSLLSTGANAQSRGDGWEFGADLLYLNSQSVDFDGGSTVDFDSDIGVSLYVGYRFSDKLEAQFGVDWSNVDYDANLVRNPVGSVDVSGEMEAFEVVPLLDGVKRGIHQVKFEHRLARHVVAGRSVHADAGEIDRRGLGAL